MGTQTELFLSGKSTPINTLKFWLRCWGEGKSKDRTLSRLPHDVYVVGTQESSMADKDWVNLLKATLKATLMVDVDLVRAQYIFFIHEFSTLLFVLLTLSYMSC